MKTWMRLGLLLVIIGAAAFAAHAQTPISSDSLAGDPTIVYKGGDPPSCVPPYCYNLGYTAAPNIVFFNVTPPLPVPPSYNCIATGGLNCSVDILGSSFISVGLYGLTNEDFTLSITGGPVVLTIPSTGITCLDNDCTPGKTVSLDPVPEPGTIFLYVTGLFLLACILRKRLTLYSALKVRLLERSPAL